MGGVSSDGGSLSDGGCEVEADKSEAAQLEVAQLGMSSAALDSLFEMDAPGEGTRALGSYLGDRRSGGPCLSIDLECANGSREQTTAEISAEMSTDLLLTGEVRLP